MTKSEAIKVLEKYKRYAEGILTDEVLDSIAFDMAIESLSADEEEENGTFVNRDNWNFNCNDSNRALVDVPSGDLIRRQWLLDLYDIDTTDFKETAKVPLEVVIQNIKDAPTIEPSKSTEQKSADVPSGDLVNRKLLIGAIEKCGEKKIYPQALIETIKALPSADRPTENFCRDCPIYSADRPQVNSNSAEEQIAEICDRPKGEWKIRDDMPKLDNTYSIECSECGQLMFGHYNADNPNYCPNCGADMQPNK